MSTTNTAVPVVFIHGLWLHATSWEPWVTLFAEAGHAPLAPGWPGEPATVAAARANPSAVAGKGIADVADHYAGVIAGLPTRPILVGHSFGGLIAQILLCRGLARAAVALDPAPFRGVLPLPASALKVAMPALRNPANRRRAVSLTRDRWGYGFANALEAAEASELYERLAVPSPARPLFEAALANLNPATPARVRTSFATRGPLLITAGDRDHAVPPVLSRWAARQYAGSTGYVEFHEFAGRGHSLVIDHGWREVADLTLSWIAEHVLPRHSPPSEANSQTFPFQAAQPGPVGAPASAPSVGAKPNPPEEPKATVPPTAPPESHAGLKPRTGPEPGLGVESGVGVEPGGVSAQVESPVGSADVGAPVAPWEAPSSIGSTQAGSPVEPVELVELVEPVGLVEPAGPVETGLVVGGEQSVPVESDVAVAREKSAPVEDGG